MGSRLLGFVALAILARLLLPHDFGIVATAMIFIGLCRTLMNCQFHLALIRLPEVEQSHYDTAFTLTLIWGLVTSAGLFLAAGFLARIMGTPEIAPVLKVMSLALLAEGVQSPVFARFERNIDMRPDVISDWTAKLAQYVVSIGLALLWHSYWALVLGFLAFTFTRIALSYFFARYRPRLSLAHARDFLSFGGWLSGTGLAGYAINFTDVALVATRLGTASVGIYNIAAEMVRMATDYLAMPLGRAIYPGLSAVSHDPGPNAAGISRCDRGVARPDAADRCRPLSRCARGGPAGSGRELERGRPGGPDPRAGRRFRNRRLCRTIGGDGPGRTRAMFARNVIVAADPAAPHPAGNCLGGIARRGRGRAAGTLMQGISRPGDRRPGRRSCGLPAAARAVAQHRREPADGRRRDLARPGGADPLRDATGPSLGAKVRHGAALYALSSPALGPGRASERI